MKRLVIIVLVVVALMLPQVVQARGGFGPGGACVVGILGFLLGAAASHPPPYAVAPPLPPHPPTQCFKEVPERPEHWETNWDSSRNAYVRELIPNIPRHFERIPCR